jgi:SAM-dependent methyltransferase
MPAVDKHFAAKVGKRVSQLRRLGPRGLVRTAYVRMLGPAVYSAVQPYRNVAGGLHVREQKRWPRERSDRLKRRAEAEVRAGCGPALGGIDGAAERRLARRRTPGAPLTIGPIAGDGSVCSAAGAIVGLDCTAADGLAQRAHERPLLVDLDGRLLVRRSFGSDRCRFLRTLEALLDLAAAGCAVPATAAVDWTAGEITTEFVHGRRFSQLAPAERGDADMLDRLERTLVQIHEAGFVLGPIGDGDILWRAGDDVPVVVGFDHAMPLQGASRDMSAHLRDRDRARFNALFGTRLVTAARLRSYRSPAGRGTGADSASVYAPVIVRDDIRWGKIWNTDVGIARWNFIMKDHLPVPAGGSVLDLGSNNGFNPLQMLRSGARSAVGVEIDQGAIDQGKFLKSAFEWLDNRTYDFRYIHGSQADLPAFGLPRFDIVTAFCSLYYLEEAQMHDLVRFIRTLSDQLVVQCNTDRLIGRNDEDTYRRASVPFAIELLDAAGFRERTVIAPAGYSRPLIIARA